MARGIGTQWRYDEARLQGRLWTPAYWQTSVWYDAADLSTLTLVSGDVSQWRDKSGFGRHLSQATAANRPTYSPFGLGGFPTLDWGTAQNTKGLVNTSLTNYSPVRYFVVADYDGLNPFDQFACLFSHTLIDVNGDRLMSASSGTSWISTTTVFQNGDPTATGTALPTISNPFVLVTNNVPAANRPDLYIGSDRNVVNRSWRGKFSEAFAVDFVPSVAEVNRAVGYAAWKYGIQLDARHPFVNRPPLIGD